MLSPFIRSVLMVLCLPIAQAQDESSAPPRSPPGRLIDVGGWRLHLNSTGEAKPSEPTVILEAGLGDFSVEWALVQPRVATFARVCSYDRAGAGWSEMGPHPRTLRQIVYELHTLLERAGLKPPFVFVGHSYGGWIAQLYAFTHPTEVAGIILVEPGTSDPRRYMEGKLVRSSELLKNQTIPPVKTEGPLRVSGIPADALAKMKAGAKSLAKNPNPPPRDNLPPPAQEMRAWGLGTVGHIAAGVNPFEHEELALLRTERAKSKHPFGDTPLVVITRGMPDESTKALEEEHHNDHAATAAMSRRGKLMVATRSGHHVQLEEPELVVDAIREVLALAKK